LSVPEAGPYTLTRRIGSGGMGEVWAATAPDGAEVAVKLLPEGFGPDARARFAREVAAARRVDHPGVQRVLDADAQAERPWLAMALVAGPTLAQRVATDGPIVGPELHDLATRLAEALAAVHAVGVVHRDVSPANVVLGADGPVLVDFGIARFAEATTLTLTGTVMGTAGWLAPEVLRDEEVTAAADVWSLGAVLAFAATGRPPADGPRAEVVLRKVLDGELDLRGLPPWLDAVVRRCLQADPSNRPAAATLFEPAATAVVPPTALQAPPTGPVEVPVDLPPERTWQPWAVRGGVLVVGAVVGLLAPPLLVVLVVAGTVLGAIGLKLWAEERAEERYLLVNPGTLVAAAVLAGVATLSQAIGLLLALSAVLVLVVVFFSLGGDFG
jgi:serine/threonine protein kinase